MPMRVGPDYRRDLPESRPVASGTLSRMLPATRLPPDAVAALAPSGRLRAAINFGNPVLASAIP